MKTVSCLIVSILLFAITPVSQADIVFKHLDGQNTSFSALKGKWVFINYWASWCETCVQEIPEFNRFYNAHKKDSVALYAVNYDDLPTYEQIQLAKQLNITYPNLLGNPAKELKLGDITGVPVTFIFNPEGKLVEKLYGGQTARALEKVMLKNLRKNAGA